MRKKTQKKPTTDGVKWFSDGKFSKESKQTYKTGVFGAISYKKKKAAYHRTIKHPLSLQTPRALSLREDRRDVSDANATQTYAHHSSQEWAFPLSLFRRGPDGECQDDLSLIESTTRRRGTPQRRSGLLSRSVLFESLVARGIRALLKDTHSTSYRMMNTADTLGGPLPVIYHRTVIHVPIH